MDELSGHYANWRKLSTEEQMQWWILVASSIGLEINSRHTSGNIGGRVHPSPINWEKNVCPEDGQGYTVNLGARLNKKRKNEAKQTNKNKQENLSSASTLCVLIENAKLSTLSSAAVFGPLALWNHEPKSLSEGASFRCFVRESRKLSIIANTA